MGYIVYDRVEGTKIEWKEGKDLIRERVIKPKKQRNQDSSACAPKNPSNTSKMYPVKEVMACGLVPSAPHPRQTSPTRFQRATKLLLLMSSLTTYLQKKQICFTELHLFHNDKTA
ncbi:hypothetical protein MJO28_006950 [Puccinia striiformis f. sp. tritici]|uniref:Uncharacterized protein n=1 Tax=Puccinia striiformis f. sp. tritici TaxID=168172 RepID=A0ACC0ECZ8_9BASI|nr:hypothetical protein MJO28_006950 [Puccinia striiformis f. sp. tritici]